jgi:hypothetical protein
LTPLSIRTTVWVESACAAVGERLKNERTTEQMAINVRDFLISHCNPELCIKAVFA